MKIVTFNANGLGNHTKRKDVFDYLRNSKFDVIFLQETHWKSCSENFIRSCWGYNCFVNGKSTNKGGVAILFNNTFEYKIHNCIKSENGNFIVLDMDLCNKRLSLVNVYGPSDRDDNIFFEEFFNTVSNVGNDMILGGDWNVPLDLNLDTRNYRGTGSRTRSRDKINNSSVELELIDVFRLIHPDKQSFTWRRYNSNVQSRLDYFLVSESLLQDLSCADIVSGYRSDHSIVTLGIRKEEEPRKRQYWKFNNSLLYDKNFINVVKDTIISVKKQYMLPIYNPDNLEHISDEDITFIINDQLFFETLLMELRGKSISYASFKKKVENELESKLIQEISNLESKEVLDDEEIILLGNKKTELESIRNKKIQGMIIRSRQQWIHKGEKPTSYFCNLENRNFTAKHMNFLEKDDNSLIFENEAIVEETKNFLSRIIC